MEEQTPQSEEQKKISKHDFYFEVGLYSPVQDSDLECEIGGLLSGVVDAYNSMDGFDTTYDIHTQSIGEYKHDAFFGFKRISLSCKRGGATPLRFVVVRSVDYIIKVGQYPSLADIQFAEIGKMYDKFLPKDDLAHFKKAIGLFAHGAGAGSFVYLRRIFENLIFGTFDTYKEQVGMTPKDFRPKHMEEKIEIIKNYLPCQLLEMKEIYPILGKGVHELTEEECLAYFPAIKLAIELILDQKIEAKQKEVRDKAVKQQLKDIHRTLSTPANTESGV